MVNRSLKRWVPLVIWVVLIFSLSSIPSLPVNYPESSFGFDKIAHFTEYLVFAFLFYRALNEGSVKKVRLICFLVIVSALGVAVLDELYQGLVGRDSSCTDGLADLAGAIAGTWGSFFISDGRESS
jgi:VanZ family protein